MVTLAVVLFLAAPARAEAPLRTFLNGKELQFPVDPVLVNGRLLVPARGYLEAMGARVGWDGTTATVMAQVWHQVVQVTIGDTRAVVNGQPATMDVEPILQNGHTLVPLRFLGEALGAQVRYDGDARRVDVEVPQLYLPDRSGPDRSRTAPLAPGAAPQVPPAAQQLQVIDGPLNLRGGPGTAQAILAVVPTGTRLDLVADGPDWAQIRLAGGGVAWVARTYTRLVDAQAAATGGLGGTAPSGAAMSQFVSLASAQVGKPYVWGATGPWAFDCSGLVQYLMAQMGVAMPRSSYDQAAMGQPVVGELLPGDVLIFSTYAPGPSHTAVYLGNGQFVNAANENTGVVLTQMNSPYWSARYLGARRVL